MSEPEVPDHAYHQIRIPTSNEKQKSEVSSDNTGHTGPNQKLNSGTPRWVIGFVIVLAIIVLVLVIMHLTGNGFANHTGMGLSLLEYRV
jgi:hypothetical protein